MSWLADELRNSRITGAIDQIERGETVDWAKLDLLSALDLVRTGQLLAADCVDREEEANARAEQLCRDRQG